MSISRLYSCLAERVEVGQLSRWLERGQGQRLLKARRDEESLAQQESVFVPHHLHL
jgi:hypothetical protein